MMLYFSVSELHLNGDICVTVEIIITANSHTTRRALLLYMLKFHPYITSVYTLLVRIMSARVRNVTPGACTTAAAMTTTTTTTTFPDAINQLDIQMSVLYDESY